LRQAFRFHHDVGLADDHTHQPGWFDLVSMMMEGMRANADRAETEPFLYSMGESLAARYPLPDARTAQDRERDMNLQLARFSWGFVQLQPQDAAILLKLHALSADGGRGDAGF
jgi:hypothetical protein